MNTYGDRLEQALQLAGRSRKDLCGAIGITLQALGQVLSGKTKALTSENSARAARFLRVSHYWLATGEGEMIDKIRNYALSEDAGSLPTAWQSASEEAREVARFALSDTSAPLPTWADKDMRRDINSMRYAALCWLREAEQRQDAEPKKIAAPGRYGSGQTGVLAPHPTQIHPQHHHGVLHGKADNRPDAKQHQS